jgi:hypothetical protein
VEEGEGEGGKQGGEMAQTMYAHVNKYIKKIQFITDKNSGFSKNVKTEGKLSKMSTVKNIDKHRVASKHFLSHLPY